MIYIKFIDTGDLKQTAIPFLGKLFAQIVVDKIVV